MKASNLLVFYLFVAFLPVSGFASDADIVIRDAWIREAPPNAFALAGYMSMENTSTIEQSLVDAAAEGFESVMIHRTVHEDGLARMKHQKMVNIPVKGKVVFEPNGYHLMLMKPAQALRAGDKVPVNLVFANGSQRMVTFEVRKRAAMNGAKGKGKCGAMKCGGGKGNMKCGGM